MTAATRKIEATAIGSSLFVSFELGEATWKLAFTVGLGQRGRQRTVAARDLAAVRREIAAGKQRFGLPADAPVKSCYEAGREGFWLHRWLEAEGIDNCVVDASSIEVNRRLRRAKTDRMDATGLMISFASRRPGPRPGRSSCSRRWPSKTTSVTRDSEIWTSASADVFDPVPDQSVPAAWKHLGGEALEELELHVTGMDGSQLPRHAGPRETRTEPRLRTRSPSGVAIPRRNNRSRFA